MRAPVGLPTRGSLRLVLAVGIGLFVAALDTYVVVTLLPHMLFDIGVPVDRIERATPVISGFLAGYLVAMPLAGLVADHRGRVFAFLVASAVFAVGSVITATAGWTGEPPYGFSGLPWLVLGRVLQGLGGGAMVPVALALVADATASGRRAAGVGIVSALQETGALLGPVFGSVVATATGTWRWAFWLNLPVALACTALAFSSLRARGEATPAVRLASRPAGPWRPGRSWTRAGVVLRPVESDARNDRGLSREAGTPEGSQPGGADWPGALLLAAALTLAVLALYPDDPAHRPVGAYFVPAGAAAMLLFAAWGWRESRVFDPLFPRSLWRSRALVGSSLANLIIGAALMSLLVDLPIEGRAVFSLDQLGAGLFLLRFMVAVPAGAYLGGRLATRGRGAQVALAGCVLAAAGLAMVSTWGAGELQMHWGPMTRADVELVITGLGFGLVIAPLAAAVLDAAPRHRHGVAASLVVMVRTFGMLMGLTLLTAYGLNRFYALFQAGGQLHLIPGSGDYAAQEAAFRQRISDALVAEYHSIFLVAAGLCLLAGAIAWFGLSARSTAGTTTRRR